MLLPVAIFLLGVWGTLALAKYMQQAQVGAKLQKYLPAKLTAASGSVAKGRLTNGKATGLAGKNRVSLADQRAKWRFINNMQAVKTWDVVQEVNSRENAIDEFELEMEPEVQE